MPVNLLEFKKLSEGVMIKRADSVYEAPQNKAWAKMKREYEIDGIILQRNQTKVPTVFNYDLGIGPIAAEYAKAIGEKARKHQEDPRQRDQSVHAPTRGRQANSQSASEDAPAMGLAWRA